MPASQRLKAKSKSEARGSKSTPYEIDVFAGVTKSWETVTRLVTWPNRIRGLSPCSGVKNKYKMESERRWLSSIFSSLNMSRPTRTHTNRLVSALSFSFFLFLALILLCPPAVSAEDKKSEYGTVIGIGTWSPSSFSLDPAHTAH